MRAYVQARTTNAPTATLPGASVYSIASRPIYIVEVGCFNTTTSACTVSLARFTTAGTPGSGLTELAEDSEITPAATGFQSHTSTPPTLAGEYVRASLGAAIGAGVIWTFGGKGIRIPAGTANGAGILCPSGTGQIVDMYIVWEE